VLTPNPTTGMADQLTSIGVEFSKVEMSRIFYELRPGAIPKPWGMGTIRNPSGPTTALDKIIGFFAAPYRKIMNGNTGYPPRRPGGYTADGCDEPLKGPNEFVHPCVRIRYLYGGLNMDDAGPWKCRALTERGYNLEPRPISAASIREFRTDGAVSPYRTVAGPVVPFYDKPPPNLDSKVAAVRTEQPFEADDLKKLEDPKTHWVWVNSNTDPKKKTLEPLYVESPPHPPMICDLQAFPFSNSSMYLQPRRTNRHVGAHVHPKQREAPLLARARANRPPRAPRQEEEAYLHRVPQSHLRVEQSPTHRTDACHGDGL
jgi:hypothetical protein